MMNLTELLILTSLFMDRVSKRWDGVEDKISKWLMTFFDDEYYSGPGSGNSLSLLMLRPDLWLALISTRIDILGYKIINTANIKVLKV